MDENKPPRPIDVAMVKAPPASIDAGTAFSFSISVKWPEGTEPEDATYLVREAENTVASGSLPEPASGRSVGLTMMAPEEVGEHHCVLTIAGVEGHDGERAEGSLPLTLITVPHATSLAVWDIPSPVVRGAPLVVKVGAKCSGSCGLSGKTIEIRDEPGNVMGSGMLGDATWEGTASLYWANVSLQAPNELGLHAWSATFSPPELKLPHGGATSRFSFVAVAEPEHSVSVNVVNKETRAPVAGAQVRVGVYRAITDEKGSVTVRVPAGKFSLIVTRAGYGPMERNIKVSKDTRFRMAAEALPEEDPFARWTA